MLPIISRAVKDWSMCGRHVRHMSATFRASDLKINRCSKAQMRKKPEPDNLAFGAVFSDHMLEIEWDADSGWSAPVINPFHSFDMHPACKVLHYAIELFEGMKAYRGVDNKVRLFRPDKNAERLYRTADRSSFPTFDVSELVECIRQLVKLDQEWVPYSTTSTLYVRPTMIATEPTLGVTQSNKALLFVIQGPVGPYFPSGFKPVTLLADPQYVRAWKGGVGEFKMGCNYAPTIQIQAEAVKKYGCQQVLWLYGEDEQWTEVGTMNVMMYWQNEQGEMELVTPPLDQGIILPGVTRMSLLELTRKWGEFKVSEKIITMKQVLRGLKEGRVKEVFGAGTAAIVAPVDGLVYEGKKIEIPTMDDGAPFITRLHKALTDIQFGRTPHPWMVDVND